MRNLREAFHVSDTLNPKLWDVQTNKLLPEVHDKIIEIVSNFEDNLSVPLEIVDIQLVGSNASYNYGPDSDLDVHIIANYDAVTPETELLQTIYNFEKTSFNTKHNIKIHGVEIEMYVQDIKSISISNGIYSVCDNEWIKEPKPITSITKHNTDKEVSKWKERIDLAISSNDLQELINLLDNIYLLRHNSLAIDGEYGKGNQIFKDVRSAGYLQKLKDAIDESTTKHLSLESLMPGQLVNRLD